MGDPERKNEKLVQCKIAVNGRKKEDDSTFVFVKFWNSTGDFVEKYFSKGRQILVEGRLEISQHDEKTYTSCVAEQVYFCGPKPNNTIPEEKTDNDQPAF